MEDTKTTPSLYADNGDEGRGAGGKCRKPPTRKPPATLYDRPLANHHNGGGGWLSKIVDPACRLIAGGATKILPSFFSKFSSSTALPPTENKEFFLFLWSDGADVELAENAEDSIKGTSSSLIVRSTERSDPTEGADRLNNISYHNELGQDKLKTSSDEADFSRVEQLLKGKTFSREEINHLLHILDPRVDDEWEKKKSGGADTEQHTLMHEIHITPSEGKQKNIDRPVVGTSLQKSDVTRMHEISIMPIEGKQQVIDRPIAGTSLQKLDVPDNVGASPVDIAQAYMGSRTSQRSHEHYSFMSKSERAQQPSDKFAVKPFIPSPSPKPSICWPGAMVHDHRGYLTPQNQRSRYGLLDFPRTPYSRSISSQSRTKMPQLQADNRSSTPLQQSQTSTFAQVKTVGDTVDSYGSVGPIRRIRNRFASEVRPRGSVFPNSSIIAPSEMVKPNLSKGFLQSTEKKLEPGETSSPSKYWLGESVSGSEPRVQNQNQSSSQAVRKILEHLDRNKPTPKEKADELKLATAWRKTPEGASDTVPKENISSFQFGELGSHKDTGFLGLKFPKEFNNDSSTSNFPVQLQDKGMDEAKGPAIENAKASSAGHTYSSAIAGANALPTFGLKKTCDPQVKNLHENSFINASNGQNKTSQHFSFPNLSAGQDMKSSPNPPGLEPSSTRQSILLYGTKPSLPSISINKPNPRAADNGLSFSFPVSASSGGLSEPPTPSIFPSSSVSVMTQPKNAPAVPSFSFGMKSTPRLVFSFESTSSTSNSDASDLKFQFGSDNKARLSFSLLGKDTICC